MLLVVRAVRNPIGVSGRLVESDPDLAGAGKGRGGTSDSEEEDSSEVSSSDSMGWWGGILEGVGGAIGDGTELSESDQKDGGRGD
jgi:hypothetical protein